MSESLHWLDPTFMKESDRPVTEEEYYERWTLVRLLLQSGRPEGPFTREEIAEWRMSDGSRPDHRLTLEELLTQMWQTEPPRGQPT